MLRLNFVYSVPDFDILERKRRCKQLKLHNFSLLMTATLSNISNQERQSWLVKRNFFSRNLEIIFGQFIFVEPDIK